MKEKKGFIIIETLMGLFVLGMIAMLISFVISFKRKYINDDSHTIQYQLFLKDIESNNMKYKLEKVLNSEVVMISEVTQKRYRMFKHGESIIISGIKNGYSPILDDVKNVSFNVQNKHLKIEVVFYNNEEYEDVSLLSYD